MPTTPGPRADPERPAASIMGAHCRISTQRMSQPVYRVRTRFSRLANRDNLFVSLSLRIMIGSAETPCCLPPLYFTLAPHFGRSTASTPTTHWPRPEVFITDTRSGNSPPRQRHGNSITQPNDPSKHHDDKSWRARELSRRTNQVLYMAARCRG